MNNSIYSLYFRIKDRLIEYDFEPTDTKLDSVFYTLMWSHSYQMGCISDNDIDETIKDVYNIHRYINNKLSRKIIKNNILKITEKWIYVSNFKRKSV